MTRNLCIILGDQLSQNITSLKNFSKEQDKILRMEVVSEATYVNHHKKKLVFFYDDLHMLLHLQPPSSKFYRLLF